MFQAITHLLKFVMCVKNGHKCLTNLNLTGPSCVYLFGKERTVGWTLIVTTSREGDRQKMFHDLICILCTKEYKSSIVNHSFTRGKYNLLLQYGNIRERNLWIENKRITYYGPFSDLKFVLSIHLRLNTLHLY